MCAVQSAGRAEMAAAFLDLQSGKHVRAEWLEYVECEAFELLPEPRTAEDPGLLAVDGEEWPLASTMVTVLPGKLQLLGAGALHV